MKKICNELEILVKKASWIESDIALAKEGYYRQLREVTREFKENPSKYLMHELCEKRDVKYEVISEIVEGEKELQKIYKLIKMRF